MIAGARKPRITRWYVEDGGKRFGPFSVGQLQTESRAGRIRPESRAIPVNEDGNIEGPPVSVKQILDLYLDPAVSLFETLRAAKDKRAPQKKHWSDPGDGADDARRVFKPIPDQAWLILGLVIVCVLLVYVAVAFVKQSGRLLNHDSETSGPARAIHDDQALPSSRHNAPAPVQTHLAPPPHVPTTLAPLVPKRVIPHPAYVPPAPTPRRDERDDRDDRRDDDRYDRRDEQQPIDRDINVPRDQQNGENLQNNDPAHDQWNDPNRQNPTASPTGNPNDPGNGATGQ